VYKRQLHGRVGDDLAAREDLDPVERVGGPLIGDRELGQAVDLVAPQVDADRRVRRRGVDVEDGASDREVAPVLHLGVAPVAVGAILVAVADSHGAIHNPDGLDVDRLIALKNDGKCVTDYLDAKKLARDDVIDVECEIWIPAARPDVVHEDNVNRLNARLVVEGANIPITHGAEKMLHDRGVMCVPDFIANAGGVICAAMEYEGATQSAALTTIEEKLRHNTEVVLEAVKHKRMLPREAAMDMAHQRVKKAMSFRRYSLFSCGPEFI